MGPTTANLFERESQLAEIRAVLKRAVAGAGALVVIDGEAGAGKSRLVGAACEAAGERGFLTISARCCAPEADFEFVVVRQLFDHVVLRMPDSQRAPLLAGPARAAERVLAVDGAAAPAGPPAPAAIHYGLFWLTARLSERQPLLIAVDDVHWSDAPSLKFLLYLARRLSTLPIVLVVSFRNGETGTDSRALLELASAPAAVPLTVPALSVHGVRRLLRTLMPAPGDAVVERCHVASGGNPFLLTELAGPAIAGDAGTIDTLAPPSLVHSMRLRLRRLGRDAAALVRALVIMGEGTELRLLAGHAGVDLDAAFAAINELTACSMLAEDQVIRFKYPVIRNAIAADLPPAVSAAMHLRAAQVLLVEGADPARIAGHLLVTPPAGNPAFVRALRAAAAAARRNGAVRTAVRYLERALEEPPAKPGDRGRVLADLGLAELFSATPAAAAAHLGESLELATTAQERAERALWLARAELATGAVARAMGVLDQAIPAAGQADEDLVLQLRGELAHLRQTHGPQSGERVPAGAGPRPSDDTAGHRITLANAALQALRSGTGPASHAVDTARRALGGGMLLDELSADNPIYYLPGLCLVYADHPHEAAAAFARALTEAEARRSPSGTATANAYRALAAHRHGDLRAAVQFGRAAWTAFAELGSPALTAEAGTLAAREYAIALCGHGEVKQAQDVVADAMDRAHAGKAPGLAMAGLHLARGVCRAAADRLDEAEEDLRAAAALAAASWTPNLPWRLELAPVLARLGKHHEAVALAEAELHAARRWGAASAVGSALRVLAGVSPDRTVALLEEAVRTLRPAPAKLELARAMVDLGAALRDADRPGCLQALRDGRDLAHRCGAPVLERRADAELRTAGARPRQQTYTGIQALTASELQVARYAAKGATNRQIAQALFVTTKTVESHLASVFRKLGISSRTNLRGVLTDGGGLDLGGDRYYCSICRTALPVPA